MFYVLYLFVIRLVRYFGREIIVFMGVLAMARLTVNDRVRNLVVRRRESDFLRAVVLGFPMYFTSIRFFTFVTLQDCIRNGAGTVFRRFIQLFRWRGNGIRHSLRPCTPVTCHAVKAIGNPAKEDVIRVSDVQVKRARGGSPWEVTFFIILLCDGQCTHYVFDPFCVVEVRPISVLVVCFRPISNRMDDVTAVEQGGLLACCVLKGVPVEVRLRMMGLAMGREDFVSC